MLHASSVDYHVYSDGCCTWYMFSFSLESNKSGCFPGLTQAQVPAMPASETLVCIFTRYYVDIFLQDVVALTSRGCRKLKEGNADRPSITVAVI